MVTSGATLVRVARYAIGNRDAKLMAVGLGSCVAVILHDRMREVGGMAHVLLPDPSMVKDPSNPFKFASTAVPRLVEEMVGAGCRPGDLEARLVGGASMFASLLAPSAESVGNRNVAASRAALREAGIEVAAEDVGGEYGRSVLFDVAAAAVRITSIDREDVVL
jgi:chemotaxis protein CheD